MIEQNEKTKLFIEKARKIHGDKYEYGLVEYINNTTKIFIMCKEHGTFEQLPSNHLKGQCCKKCSIENIKLKLRSNTKEFIEKSMTVHYDKYDYSKVIYVNCKTKIIIICKEHGEFLQTASDHLTGYGCKKCGNIQISLKKSSNNEEFIKRALIVHGDKYDYSKVVYVNCKTKIIIICKEHGEFLQVPSSHIHGESGCDKCGNVNSSLIQRKTTKEFIEEAKEIHGDKYDYSKVKYVNCKTNIIIICKEHGEFSQTPDNHIRSQGCKKCGYIQMSIKNSSNTKEFIEKAKEIHGDKYDYSKVEYICAIKDVIIICKIHGEFEQTPNSHLSNYGCIKCGHINSSLIQRKTTNEFIEKSIIIYGDKYDYSKVNYIKCDEKVIIICKLHGEFEQTPTGHYAGGDGCNKCSIYNYSKSSIKYLDFISKYNNIFIKHAENNGEFLIPNTNYKADGYCKETNTIYEYHGDYWHGNPDIFCDNQINNTTKCTFGELYQKTLEREQLIRYLGYNLVVMWEHDWNKLNKFIRTLQQKFKQLH
jgi:hypothetical protein